MSVEQQQQPNIVWNSHRLTGEHQIRFISAAGRIRKAFPKAEGVDFLDEPDLGLLLVHVRFSQTPEPIDPDTRYRLMAIPDIVPITKVNGRALSASFHFNARLTDQ